MNRSLVALLGVVLLSACSPDIGLTPDPEPLPTDAGTTVSNFQHSEGEDGVVTTTVDATSQTQWYGLDLDQRVAADASRDAAWDLAFQRFHIRTRGGVNGSGGVQVAVVTTTGFDALTRAPADGYLVDAADGADPRQDSGTAFERGEGWYSYDPVSHSLTARPQVYVVRSDAGRYFKVQLLSYYDAAGVPAVVRFQWKEVAAPEPSAPSTLAVDASSSEAWVYLKVGTGLVQVAEPATSSAWDLAIRRTQLRTNSGVSGSGLGGAKEVGGAFDSLTHAPTVGFVRDALLPVAGPPGSGEAPGNAVLGTWFDYDATTHVVSPRATTFLLRTASGAYGKLQIASYAAGKYTLRLEPVARQVTPVTLEVNATDSARFVPVDLALGTLPTIEDLTTSAGWDLALRRVALQTNGGTSGPGTGGAQSIDGSSLDGVLEAPGEGYVADALVTPSSGAPYSANAVLSDWYDYNPTTHQLSPKAKVFFVKVAAGGFAKARILSYASGTYSLEYAYSGPGRSDF